MSADEIDYLVSTISGSLIARLERLMQNRVPRVVHGSVTSTDPPMVRVDGSRSPVPVNVRGQISIGERVSVLISGTSYYVL